MRIAKHKNDVDNVVRFRLKNKPTREHVVGWLRANFDSFPAKLDSHQSNPCFDEWTFVYGPDGEVCFANYVDPEISEREFSDKPKALSPPQQVARVWAKLIRALACLKDSKV